MRIFKRGRIALPWCGDWYCPRCNAGWTMTEADTAPQRIEEYSNDYYSMPCPECNTPVNRAAVRPDPLSEDQFPVSQR